MCGNYLYYVYIYTLLFLYIVPGIKNSQKNNILCLKLYHFAIYACDFLHKKLAA